MDDVSDESVMELEKRKFYMQSYSFTLMGFLIDENEFQVKPAVSRTLALFEVNTGNKRVSKKKQIPENTKNISLKLSYEPGQTTITKVFEYSADLTIDGNQNISSYSVYVNGLFFGQNIFASESGKLQVNTNDSVEIQITQTNPSDESYFVFNARLV
jgi:hypothetical protein